MANYIQNDRGESVIAVGAPGSLERVKVQYPELIREIDNLYFTLYDCPGKGVDAAIQHIRDNGIRNYMETDNILLASCYRNEKGTGSVTDLVLCLKEDTK